MKTLFKEVEKILLKNIKGVVKNNFSAYKPVQIEGLITYDIIEVKENSIFNIVSFNLYTKRVKVFNTYNNVTNIIEVNYDDIINNCKLSNVEDDNIFKNVNIDAVLVLYKEKKTISKEVFLYSLISFMLIVLGYVIGKI